MIVPRLIEWTDQLIAKLGPMAKVMVGFLPVAGLPPLTMIGRPVTGFR